MAGERVLLIARDSAATRLLFHALATRFDVHVLLEHAPTTTSLLRSRIKRLGLATVIGQVLFQLLVAKPQSWLSRRRREEIIRSYGASTAPIPDNRIQRIGTVNSDACIDLVRQFAPSALAINGTRILKEATIRAFAVPVLNTHVGITPMYRGVHGAYWALAQNDRANCGVTIHLVDAGIDTGGIIHQAIIEPTSADNFSTYPVLQMAVGAPLLVSAMDDAIAGRSVTQPPDGPSRRWNHPTLWQYVANRLSKGVK